jgi:hypothetical protein
LGDKCISLFIQKEKGKTMSNEERMAFTSQPKGRGFSATNTIKMAKTEEQKPDYSSAIKIRNKSWEKNEYIPSWVKIEEVGLDPTKLK